jgi:hypothetical protein
MPLKDYIFGMITDPTANTAGGVTTVIALLNSVFQMLNPVLTGIFYIASIGWLGVQIYHKIKYKK